MKINHAKAIKAYKALNSLSQQQMPVSAALALFKAKKALQGIWDFSVQEETKLHQMCNPKFDDNGKMTFDDAENEKIFYSSMTELMGIEHDVELEPVTVEGIEMITVEQMENLDGIVTFE